MRVGAVGRAIGGTIGSTVRDGVVRCWRKVSCYVKYDMKCEVEGIVRKHSAMGEPFERILAGQK